MTTTITDSDLNVKFGRNEAEIRAAIAIADLLSQRAWATTVSESMTLSGRVAAYRNAHPSLNDN